MTWRPSAEKACASTRLPRRCRAPQRPRQRNDSALPTRAAMIGLTTNAEDEMHDDAVSTAVVHRTAGCVPELGTILGIWAHPDDEAYLSGGLMAMARDNGSRVVCVTATRGELGTPDPVAWPLHRLATARTGELARCLEILGVTEHHWLGYRDGECATVHAADAVAQLCGVIGRVGPDTVLTFGPDGITGHPDHQAVSGLRPGDDVRLPARHGRPARRRPASAGSAG